MLAGAGLGDNFGFTHPFGQQGLAQHLVGFVRAAVQQIFAFQIQGGAGAIGQIPAFGQGRRTTGVVFSRSVNSA